MLEVAGSKIADLGRDVEREKFIEESKDRCRPTVRVSPDDYDPDCHQRLRGGLHGQAIRD